MNIKYSILIICLCGLSFTISAQQYAVGKKATIISGTGIFTSQGGDLFEDADGNRAATFTFSPMINHFVTKNFFIGGGIELSTESQGDYKSTGFGIGPQAGFAFGGPQSKAFPFVDLGIRYYTEKLKYNFSDEIKISGSDVALGFGVIFPVKEHIGLIFEGGYHFLKLKDKDSPDSYSGNMFSIGIGIAGLLFNDAE